ncbi:hypothetical protein V8E51_014655 [Hyaloscypha variabilis]
MCARNPFFSLSLYSRGFPARTHSSLFSTEPTASSKKRPYCPPRPTSPEFQRADLYEYLSEYFFETGGIVSVFDNFIDANYIQHSPNEPPYGRNASLAEILKAGDSFSGVNVTTLKVLFDSPYRMVHWRLGVPGEEPFAFVDMWRV